MYITTINNLEYIFYQQLYIPLEMVGLEMFELSEIAGEMLDISNIFSKPSFV